MSKQFSLYRMVMDKHVCPYGLLAKHLLKQKGYEVEDHHLKTKEETEQFKASYNVKTTPQIFLGSTRIGGYTDLKKYLGLKKTGKNYKPIVVIFVSTLLMSITLAWPVDGLKELIRSIELFVALSMCVLAILKLRDIEGFVLQFLNYDLLARKFVQYAYIYPIAELIAGIGMLSVKLTIFVIPLSLFIGLIGALSVIKAVYIEKRELKCACVGGGSEVPLGVISLTENVMMILLPIWMIYKLYLM